MPEEKAKEKTEGKKKKKIVKKPVTIPADRRISIHVYLRVAPLNKNKDLKKMTVDGLFYIKSLLTTTYSLDVYTKSEWNEKIKDLLSKNR